MVRDAWRDGLGPDDRARLADLLARGREPELAGDPAVPELRVFAALYDLLSDVRAEVPPAPPGPAARVLHLAAAIEAGRLARDPVRLDALIGALSAALDGLRPGDPNAG